MTQEEKLQAIFKKIGREAILEQIVEENAELIQTAAKQLRILRGANYTPVKLSENSNNLLEEAADTLLNIDLLAVSFNADTEKTKKRIEEIKNTKLNRWLDRLGIKAE